MVLRRLRRRLDRPIRANVRPCLPALYSSIAVNVTDDGSDGKSLDQRTCTSPIFGKRSFRPVVMVNRALRVNRIACRGCFRDRNLGGSTFGPFRFPVTEAKKFR